jgi:hypothetical protein
MRYFIKTGLTIIAILLFQEIYGKDVDRIKIVDINLFSKAYPDFRLIDTTYKTKPITLD